MLDGHTPSEFLSPRVRTIVNHAAFIARDDGSLDARDTRVGGFAWSLDGAWIALRGLHQEPSGLVIDRSDVDVLPLAVATDPACVVRLDHTAAARQIVFLADSRLLVQRDDSRGSSVDLIHELPDGGVVARRAHTGRAPWSPQRSRDGTRVLLHGHAHPGGRYTLVDSDGRVLFEADERSLLGRVSAAFLATRLLPYHRAVLDPDGARLALAVDFTNEVDTTRIAFLDLAHDEAARSRVVLPWVGDFAFTGPAAVVHVIAFDLRLRVARIERGSSAQRAIEVPTGLVGTRRGFALSPDETAVLVVTNDRVRPVALHHVRLDTGEARVLREFAPDQRDAIAVWSPAGEVILAWVEPDRIVLSRGDALVPFAEIEAERFNALLSCEVSPDGRWIALHWLEGTFTRRLRLMPLHDR